MEFLPESLKNRPVLIDLAIVVLLFCVLIVSIFPLLFDNRIFNTDMLSYFYPVAEFYHQALINRDSFLWNPWIFSGFPMYVSQTGGFFDPVSYVIFSFFDGVTGSHLRLFIGYFLALIFSYFAGRAYGISRLASILIGTGYLMAYEVRFFGAANSFNSVFFLPFLVWIFLKSRGSKRSWAWILGGGLGLGWALLSGWAQFILYAITCFGFFTLIYIFVCERKSVVETLKASLRFFIPTVFLGAVVALPQILASLKWVPFSFRAGGIDYATAGGRAIGLNDLLFLLFPSYLYFPYLAVGRKPLFVGVFLFFAASSLFIMFLRKLKFLKEKGGSGAPEPFNYFLRLAVPLIFVVVFAFIASFYYSPLGYVLHHLPLFKSFRYLDRWMLVGAFFLAMLGALGFDAFRYFAQNQILKKWFAALGFVVGGITFLTLSLNFLGDRFWASISSLLNSVLRYTVYGRFGFTKDPLHYYNAVERGISAWREFLSFSDPFFLIPFLALLLSYLACAGFIWEKIGWRVFRLLGFSLSLLMFIVVHRAYIYEATVSQTDLEPYAVLADAFIPKEDRLIYRVFPVLLDYGYGFVAPPTYKTPLDKARLYTKLKYVSGWTNTNMGVTLSVDGYEPLLPRAYFDALARVGSIRAGEYARIPREKSFQDTLETIDVIGMMGGKYFISGLELKHQDLSLAGIHYVTEEYKIPLFVYINKQALPRFYLAKRVMEVSGKSLPMLLDSGMKDFGEVTYLDCSGCAKAPEKLESRAELKLAEMKNDRLVFNIKNNAPQWLVVSESFLPGWRAELNSDPLPIVRANGLYMAFYIPPGENKVSLNYNGILGEAGLLRALGVMD